MKTTLSELKKRHEEASKLSATLLSDLTSKSCHLERLKALLGHGSSVLSAMQVVGEQQRLLAENEEDDEELLAVFVDRQSSRLELILHRAREQLVVAEKEERETKLAMNKTKQEVWQYEEGQEVTGEGERAGTGRVGGYRGGGESRYGEGGRKWKVANIYTWN